MYNLVTLLRRSLYFVWRQGLGTIDAENVLFLTYCYRKNVQKIYLNIYVSIY